MLGSGPSTGLGRIFDPPPTRTAEDELATAYRDDAAQRGLEVEMATTFLDFARKMPTAKRPLDLVRFAFQVELYNQHAEFDKRLDVEKAAQLGISEWLVRLALRLADKGMTVLYVMPKLMQATEFSDRRVKTVIQASDYLRRRQDMRRSARTDNKRLKSIGDGYLAIRGSKSRDDLHEIDADAVIMDEYDRLVQGNLPELEQRASSAFSPGILRAVSTPTLPNYGIDRRMKPTDHRYWTVRCGGLNRKGKRGTGCGDWVRMAGYETFDSVLDHASATLLCPGCGRPLDVREGEWVPTYTDGDRPRGYHMSKFVVPGIDLAAIVERSKATSEKARRAFHNQDLGEAWQAANAGLTDEQLAAATRAYSMQPDGYVDFKPVTMGVDVAGTGATSRALNVRISLHVSEHEKVALWIGEVDDGRAPWGATTKTAFEILAECMVRFKVHVAVIDHMPDPRVTRALCERFHGRMYRVQWFDKLSAVLTRPDPKGDPTKLHARYLEGIDATLDLVRRQANLLPEDRPEDYDEHMKGRVLTTVEPDEEAEEANAGDRRGAAVKSTDGEIRQAWIKVGPDDYLQAEAYDVIATHMMYVHRAQGGIAAQNNQLVSNPPDLVAKQQEWRDDAAMIDPTASLGDDGGWSDGPSDEPLSGWD